jgi:hypothetical protein
VTVSDKSPDVPKWRLILVGVGLGFVLFVVGAGMLGHVLIVLEEIPDVEVPEATPMVALPRANQALKIATAYVLDTPDVLWVEVVDREVFIGYDPAPQGWQRVVSGAARTGSRVLGSEVRVTAVNNIDFQYPPVPTDVLGTAVARGGKVTESPPEEITQVDQAPEAPPAEEAPASDGEP